jgi:predicted ATP-dependent endonuclease of OLD family
MAKVQVRIRNLGNIKDARLRVGDLNIFVGKNNTNKTWTAYVFHAISSESMIEDYVNDFMWNRLWTLKVKTQFFKEYANRAKEYLKSPDRTEEKSVKGFFSTEDIPYIKELIKDYLKFVSENFYQFISIDKDLLKDLKITLLWPDKRKKDLINSLVTSFNKNFDCLVRGNWFQDCIEEDAIFGEYYCCLMLVLLSATGTFWEVLQLTR